jgi:hypothetical protein
MTKPTVEELLEWITTAKNHYPYSPSVEVVCNALRERLVGEQWQPIATVPLGEMVMLIGGGWRHEFAGQVGDRETGFCILDTPTPQYVVPPMYAQYWKPLSPSPEPSDGKE